MFSTTVMPASSTRSVFTSDSQADERWSYPSRVGIVDVGSNTVRFVVFDFNGRVPQPVFNERAFCGLGRHLATTGKLSPSSRSTALKTIHRFTTLAGQMQVDHLQLVGTAAVREATNGPAFVDDVYATTGYPLRVLSGDEEAHYAASGVYAGIPDARGVAGDLGGGSLELVGLTESGEGDRVSLPLGTLRLLDAYPHDIKAAAAEVKKQIDAVGWLEEFAGQNLYAVGGIWRALARLHMAARDYPLQILHNYVIDGKEARRFARQSAEFVDEERALDAGVAFRRVGALQPAALVANYLLNVLKPRYLTISALGLREGILYDKAPRTIRSKDPLIEYSVDTAQRRSRFPEHGNALMRWIDPIYLDEDDNDRRLRLAVCTLSDVGWSGHPSYRAEYALDQILYSQILGVNHRDRAFIALVLFVINGGNPRSPSALRVRALLSRSDIAQARKLGLALRLGQRISGGTKKLLRRATLELRTEELHLVFNKKYSYMAGESVNRRLKALASSMHLKGKVLIRD